MGMASRCRRIVGVTVCLMLLADSVWAHPGHGMTDPEGPVHYVLEPLHALPVLLVVLAIGAVWGVLRRRGSAAHREQESNE